MAILRICLSRLPVPFLMLVSVGVVIQPLGIGTPLVTTDTREGEASISLPSARGNPVMQLDQRGTELSDATFNKVVASSVPDRMAIALQAAAVAPVDDEDEVVSVPVWSSSGAVAK